MSKNKILKVRPGHLANFSGGSGYLPVFASLAWGVAVIYFAVVNIIVYSAFKGFKKRKGKVPEKVELAQKAAFATRFILGTIIIASIISIGICVKSISLIYTKDTYEILKLSVAGIIAVLGPFVGVVLGTWLLLRQAENKTKKDPKYTVPLLVFLGVSAGTTFVGYLMMGLSPFTPVYWFVLLAQSLFK